MMNRSCTVLGSLSSALQQMMYFSSPREFRTIAHFRPLRNPAPLCLEARSLKGHDQSAEVPRSQEMRRCLKVGWPLVCIDGYPPAAEAMRVGIWASVV